ncbi:MAG: hypothetical protein V4565_04130 [Bacteroidota bacterium]
MDNKIIYESNHANIKFIPNNTDNILIVYNDGVYKLIKKFNHLHSKNLDYQSSSGEDFYIKDSICTSKGNYSFDSETCSDIEIHRITLENWDYNNQHASTKFRIRLVYRLCSLVPIDTSNYLYNSREGLWIGSHRGVEKVTVNYRNDKKHGIATAYYDNGTTYNVNYNNGIADNYGQGYWKNYKSKLAYTIPKSVTSSCDSIKMFSHESFHFSKDSILKEVHKHNDLSVHYEQKGILHDSLQYRVRGDFISISNDTITIRTSELEVHDYYKKNTDTLHNFYRKIETGFAKVPTKDITKIYYSRGNLQTLTTLTSFLSFASALIVAPLISIQKGGFNRGRYKKVSLTSFGVMTLSISFGIGFSQKGYLLKPTKKRNKIWKIEHDAYE